VSKPSKSQWDFGELFPTEATRKVLSVGELTLRVKGLLEKQVGQIWVTGEISNFRAQSSGHFYFTLKDADSQLNCVLFRTEARETRGLLQDGRKVILQGDLTVYEPRGQYQLRVSQVELVGVGALQAAFERLKQKLNADGWFASECKRPLPRFPRRIGIVTSPTGAAIRDVLHVVKRRNPALEIVIASCRVQGQGAAEEIATAIRLLNQFNAESQNPPPPIPHSALRTPHLDLILVTRGGGSLEDLWAFNEEVVARAIFESALPVISAVGHEIDFTISDFVADLRAATPSAAAEILTEGVFASGRFLELVGERMRQLLGQRLLDKEEELARLGQRLARVHPRRRLEEWSQRLDDLRESISRRARQGMRERALTSRALTERLLRLRPKQILAQRRELTIAIAKRLHEQARWQIENKRARLATLESRLRLLGPEQVLARGYSITTLADTGKVIRAASEVQPGQKLRTRLKSGEIRSVVEGASGQGS
jgi:exodeoxyribonuclease VII large subunit